MVSQGIMSSPTHDLELLVVCCLSLAWKMKKSPRWYLSFWLNSNLTLAHKCILSCMVVFFLFSFSFLFFTNFSLDQVLHQIIHLSGMIKLGGAKAFLYRLKIHTPLYISNVGLVTNKLKSFNSNWLFKW